jgi:hypothetical protein
LYKSYVGVLVASSERRHNQRPFIDRDVEALEVPEYRVWNLRPFINLLSCILALSLLTDIVYILSKYIL